MEARAPRSAASRLRGLLTVLRPTPSVDARSFHRGARARTFAQLLRLRLVLAPAVAVVASTFAFFEPTLWRRVVLLTTAGFLLLLSFEEFLRARAYGTRDWQLTVNLALMAASQMAVLTATGGLISPVLPGALALTLMSAVLLERRADLVPILSVQLPTIWCLAWVHHTGEPVDSLVPEVFGGFQPLERGAAPWVLASVYSAILIGATRIGGLIRSIFEALFEEAIEERDRALAMHAEHGRALGALSGELAHELKNPLASVKGLAALVARGAEGKSAERLGVMRREVDRMQGILDELLTFSRPLVPLSTEEVALGELVEDVARLFEATSAERRVEIVARAPRAAPVRCDPRKVRQIVINLVQNALDASPSGATIEVTVEPSGGGATIVVRDEGEGLDPEVAERVFEAGVTSKERGSGLGLAVARSLARQHGGELTLRAGAPRGCVAELTLPAGAAE